MHLSDEQILETDAIGELHLSQCNDCKMRAVNLLNLRKKLNQLPSARLEKNNWEKISYTYQLRSHDIKKRQTKKRMRFWKLSSATLAASLILVAVFPKVFFPNKDLENQQQLMMIIEQNNLLQQQLIVLRPEIAIGPVNLTLFRSELSVLDQSILRAHMQKMSIKEKTEFWLKRQDLLVKWLTKKSSLKTLSI